METIKWIIMAILAAGLLGALVSLASLWGTVIKARKQYIEAEADGQFTDAEYVLLGKSLVDAIKECKSIMEFITRLAINLQRVTIRKSIRLSRKT